VGKLLCKLGAGKASGWAKPDVGVRCGGNFSGMHASRMARSCTVMSCFRFVCANSFKVQIRVLSLD